MWIRRVFSFDSAQLEQLFLSLSPDDRYFRFCGRATDETIQRYIGALKWREICVYGMFEHGKIIGAVELVPTESGTELAIVVRHSHKRKGIGKALMERAMVHARVRGLRKLQILCRAENEAMQALARGVGMRLTREYGEVEGRVKVGSATPADYMSATWSRIGPTAGFSRPWARDALWVYHKARRIRATKLKGPSKNGDQLTASETTIDL